MASVMSLSEPLALRTQWWLNTAFVIPLLSEMAEVAAVSVSPTSALAGDGWLAGGGYVRWHDDQGGSTAG